MSNDFGIIKYTSYNIGDDIQTVAAKRFLPQVDHFIHRERVGDFFSERKTKLLMNAWWMWEPEKFPPSDSIDPLLISMYFRPEIRSSLLKAKVKEYLIKNGPVGCRDTATAEFLNENGIPSYFSGCLTLTLKKYENVKKENFILTVDLPDEAVEYIRRNSKIPVYNVSRMINPYFDSLSRIEIAELILYLYQSAKCVISPCLHVVLPCLAIETPVLRVNIGDTTGAGDQVNTGDVKGRYSGMEHLAHKTTIQSLLEGDYSYDFNNPPENPQDYKVIREALIEKAKAFTGYDDSCELRKFDFPLINVFELLKENKDMNKNSLYYASVKDLLSVLFERLVKRKNRFDV